MATKRLASASPTPLRRSKRVVQQPAEEPSSSPANENAEAVVECPEPLQKDGDYEEEELSEDMSEEMDIEGTDIIMQNGLGDELLLAAVEDEMEVEIANQKEMNLPSDIFERPDVDWLDTLLEVSSASTFMKLAIKKFAIRLGKRVYPQSLVDVTDYRSDTGRIWWHSHCQKMDAAWEGYLEGLSDILGEDSGFDISTLSKPSGPIGAALYMQWHFPTWTTAGSEFNFCHVMEKKIGHTPDVCTSDMIPIREDSRDPKWENIFGATKWAAIRSLSIDFSYSIMKYSPVVVLVGKSCFETFERLLRQDNSIRLVKVLLGVSTRIFGQDACFYVAKDPVSDEIRQLIFLSPHGSRFVFGSTPKEAAYTDLIWNAAAATASIDIVSPDLFGWFTAKTNKDASKITDARRAGGWQELARGVETRRAKGFLELKRGHVTMKAQGYPGLARAREAQRVAGYPELAKARASLAARGNPHMKAAHDANRAKGAEHTKPAMEASKVKCKALRLDRTQVLLNSFDVKYLLHHTPSYYDDNDNAKNTYSLFAELRGWPNLWETFNPRRKAGYKQQLKKAHEYFTTLRNSLDGLLQTRTEDGKKIPHTAYQRKYALWYDKDKHPYGLRWEGDGGLADDNTNGDPNIAISIFWHYETKSLKEQNEFAQLIRDALQRGHTASPRLVDLVESFNQDDGNGSNDIDDMDIDVDDADNNGSGSEASSHTAQETSGPGDGNRPLEIPDSDSDQED
ncbi:hypothetical protein HDV62DRAFT_399353 [Trichoderma sp. SZMC 28011]